MLARASCARYASAGVLAVALLMASCNSPSRAIRPVIHARDEDKYQAMKSAPVIVLAEIVKAKLVSGAREVEKPEGVGGPVTPTIPLHLAKISAKVLLTLRGTEGEAVEFYSWVWASGSHGGPRLFYVGPGSKHILFLREEGGYLHTVGDYPAYDLEISSVWLPEFQSEFKSTRYAKEADFEGAQSRRLAQWFRSCEARTTAEIDYARQNNWRWPFFDDGWRQTPERRRLTMRLYASAMDREFQQAACEAAASMPEAGDIPECSAVKNNASPSSGKSRAVQPEFK